MTEYRKAYIPNRYLIYMKLQSQVSRKVGDTEYTKFWVVLPQKVIRKLGWKTGQELDTEIKGDKLVVEKED